jgi:hypothetical protein
MRPLAEQLTGLETGSATWTAGAPGDLTPELHHDGESSIDPPALIELITTHLT